MTSNAAMTIVDPMALISMPHDVTTAIHEHDRIVLHSKNNVIGTVTMLSGRESHSKGYSTVSMRDAMLYALSSDRTESVEIAVIDDESDGEFHYLVHIFSNEDSEKFWYQLLCEHVEQQTKPNGKIAPDIITAVLDKQNKHTTI